mmetsp:Transcript_3324/g.8894  ORF Transcript_3324/g.8894 Transcript_3324/m.8894 type:complete len:99 (-) Transcript_3324:8-304(-)
MVQNDISLFAGAPPAQLHRRKKRFLLQNQLRLWAAPQSFAQSMLFRHCKAKEEKSQVWNLMYTTSKEKQASYYDSSGETGLQYLYWKLLRHFVLMDCT